MGSIFSASKYLKWANYEGSAPLSQKETKSSCFTMGRNIWNKTHRINYLYTVKLGNKERFDKEQIGIKEPFPATNLPFTS